nr:MAG: protein of unknown function DUF2828 [Lokiarchaeota virus Skoll Meg22_1214]
MDKKSFVERLIEESNYTLTENQALTYISTLDDVLNFFSVVGALRQRSEKEIQVLFDKAYHSNPLLALKTVFYARDIRGGLGERRTFRILLEFIGRKYPEVMKKNMWLIPHYGRWDDVYSLVDTPLHHEALEFIADQLRKDLDTKIPSLAGKWAKSINTSSSRSNELGTLTRKKMGLSEKQYRKMLSKLRTKINIVEKLMCQKRFNEIDYEKVPSRASLIYREAFKRNDPERYEEYLKEVEKGTKKIQTATLFPHDVLIKAIRKEDPTAELMWKNLPNYLPEGEESAIVVADTSGSMVGFRGRGNVEPIMVSVSLAIYFGERCQGPFKDHFITFSRNPTLQKIKGHALKEKYDFLSRAEWEMNTDLQAVFDLILNTAVKHGIKQEEMPSRIFIISDMEFDAAIDSDKSMTNFELIKKKYEDSGYQLPKLIFWNVESRHDQFPVLKDEENVFLVSGFSASVFKDTMNMEAKNPIELMLEILNSPRYEPISI